MSGNYPIVSPSYKHLQMQHSTVLAKLYHMVSNLEGQNFCGLGSSDDFVDLYFMAYLL